MKAIATTFMFKSEAEAAAKLYVSIFAEVFGRSEILKTTYYGRDELGFLKDMPGMTDDMLPAAVGDVKSVRFTLNGEEFIALNGGSHFGTFHESVSLYVTCSTQAQIDTLWERLSEGGMQQPCGWVKDRFGVSWQIAPEMVWELVEGDDQAKSQRMMIALYRMGKINIEELKRAAG